LGPPHLSATGEVEEQPAGQRADDCREEQYHEHRRVGVTEHIADAHGAAIVDRHRDDHDEQHDTEHDLRLVRGSLRSSSRSSFRSARELRWSRGLHETGVPGRGGG
jgi:hypothetical protein